MGKTYTESELLEMGISQEQIDSIISDEKKLVNFDKPEAKVVQVKRPTSIGELKKQSQGELVELPGFIENEPFIARLRRPSMLSLVENGKIPNTLLTQAENLFSNGASKLGGNKNSLKEMYDVIKILCDASMLEPTYQELQDNEIELTDEQLMAIFAYTQRGIKAVETFRS